MAKWAYYNEFDPAAASWLRELIKAGQIMDGEVDERSITEVQPEDVRGFIRVGFFAGVGGWDLALQRAGYPTDRPVWHGSCPCQAFSCAGKGEGVSDHRDLWPVFARLIRECRPVRVFGEQVEAAVGHGWLDRLSADLEAEDYAVGAVVLGAHSAGADHQRQRLYWVADACIRTGKRITRGVFGAQEEVDSQDREKHGDSAFGLANGSGGEPCGMADAEHAERRPKYQEHAEPCRRDGPGRGGTDGGVGNAQIMRSQGCGTGRKQEPSTHAGKRIPLCDCNYRNFWSNAVAIPCRDGTFRRVEPGIFPLVDGLPRGVVPSGDTCAPGYANETAEARVMRLKGYGNAINVETARMFIEAVEGVL